MKQTLVKQAVVVLIAAALLASPLSAGAGTKVQADVVYGHKMGMALTFDALVPAEQNGAAVLFMVSGGWFSRWSDPHRIVSGEGRQFGAVGELLDHGYAVFMVRHGSAPLFKVPEAVADVRRAVRYIRLNADDFGIDADRMGVFGGSAGGHLSLMLGNASDEGNSESNDPIEQTGNRVAAVVAYFPPVDLQGIAGPNDRFPGPRLRSREGRPHLAGPVRQRGRPADVADSRRPGRTRAALQQRTDQGRLRRGERHLEADRDRGRRPRFPR